MLTGCVIHDGGRMAGSKYINVLTLCLVEIRVLESAPN